MPRTRATHPTHPTDCTPLGVLGYNGVHGLFVRREKGVRVSFSIVWEDRAGRFGLIGKDVSIRHANGTKENPHACSHFRFFYSGENNGESYVMTYVKVGPGKKKKLVIATAHDIYSWLVRGTIDISEGTSAENLGAENTAFISTGERSYHLYKSGLFATYGESADLKAWTWQPDLLFTSRPGSFDAGQLAIIGACYLPQGILVIYDASAKDGPLNRVAAGAVLFSTENPTRILWRSSAPLWEGLVYSKDEELKPLGSVVLNGQLGLYWASAEGSIIRVIIDVPQTVFPAFIRRPQTQYLHRSHKNPVMAAQTHREWEAEAVFNPAAIYDNGRVHLLYRAIGRNGLSVLGYASSADGLHFDDRSAEPVFSLDGRRQNEPTPLQYSPMLYPSGGSWGGTEDPRIVNIENKIYLTFTAFDDWSCIRVGASSIDRDDFLNKRWRWTEPILISPPGQIHKNWVLFPEKINGKFAILHSVTPEIKIDYVTHLEDLATGKYVIKSRAPGPVPKSPDRWENIVRGAGPPPIKTKAGWLVFYHAIEHDDPGKYKLGALLLDLHHPEKIIARAPSPLLSPDMWYENEGKPGIVYACGAIVHNDDIAVYYGGGDKHVCLATASLNDVLEKIQGGGHIALKPKKRGRVSKA
jgi:predicted GH43/DUF377 family glycosyl hydrolase